MNNNLTTNMNFEPSSYLLRNLFAKIGNPNELMGRIEKRFLENSERLQWGYNRSDIPVRPSVATLNGNDVFILDFILEGKNGKCGYQRTLDNKVLALSEDSFNKNHGRLIFKPSNDAESNPKPALKWVKFSVFGVDDISESQLKSSLKRKAGLEMFSFLDYFSGNIQFFARYFGPYFVIEGCNFMVNDNGHHTDCQVGINVDEVSNTPVVDIFQGEARNYTVQYIIDDIVN